MLEIMTAQKPIKLLLLGDRLKKNNQLAEWLDICRSEIEPICVHDIAIARTRLQQESFDVVLLNLLSDNREDNIQAISRYFAPNSEDSQTLNDRDSPLPPLILLSDRDDPELATLALGAGAEDFLVSEEIDRRQFLRTLRYTCIRHTVARANCDRCPSKTEGKFTAGILNAIADPVFVKNQQNRYIVVNDAYCQWLGKTRKEILGKSPADFFTPEEVALFAQQDRELWQTEISRTCERSHQDRQGHWHRLMTKISVFTDESGKKSLVGVIRDVTEQYRDRDRAKNSETLLDTILNTVPDPIFVKDEEHRWILLNDSFCNLMERSRSQLIGKSDYDFFPPAEADVFWEKDEWVLKTGQDNENEESFTDAKGSQHTISTKKSSFSHTDGRKILVGCIRDITQDKQQEAIIQKRQRYLSALVAIQQMLLGSPDPRTCYDRILQLLGTTSGASRVYLFENHYSDSQDLLMSQKAEWCAPGIYPQVDNLIYQNFPDKDFSPEFADILASGETISDLVDNLASPMKEILSEREILSILVLPLQVNGKFFGFIGFDNCREAKIWDTSEVSLLQSVAASISLAQQQWQAEVALQESEARYRCIVETANEGIMIIDRQGCIEFANHRAAGLIGYTPQDIISQSCADFMNAEMQAMFAQMLQRRQIAGSERYDLKLTHRSGKSVWVMVSASLLWQNGQFIGSLGMMTDITQRKKAEADRDRFFTLSADMLCIAGVDGYFKRVNPAWSKRLGYSSATLLSQPYLEFVHPDDRDKTLAEASMLASASNSSLSFQNRYRCNNGDYKWLEWSATSYLEEGLIYAVARDITPEKEADAALRESTQRLAAAQKVAQMGDWEIDLVSGRITWSDELFRIYGLEIAPQDNPAAKKLTSSSTIIGEEYLQYIHPDDRTTSQQAMQKAIVTGQPYEVEQRIQRPDGKMRYLLLRGEPVTNETGQVIRLFGTALDISDRKQIEQRLHWQETLLRSMADASPLAFFVVDNRSDEILYFNQRFCEIWGLQHHAEGMRRGELKNNDIIPDCIPLIADLPAFIESCKPLQSETNRTVIEDEIAFTDGRTIRRFSAQIRNESDRYFGRLYLFEDITPRKQAEAALEHRMAIEALVTSISTQFINLDVNEIDRGINDALEQIGIFAEVDRAYLFQLSDNGETISNTHEWCHTGISVQIENTQNISVSTIPWFMDKLQQFELICVPSLEELPLEAEVEREIFVSQEIQSILCIPMSDRGRVVGFVGFDAVREPKIWSSASINVLRLVGEIFTNALERKRVELVLKESEEKYRNLQETFSDAILITDLEGNLLEANRKAEELLGYSKTELSQMHFRQIHPSEELPQAIANFAKDAIAKRPSYFSDTLVLTKNGERISVDISTNFSKVAGKWLVQKVFRDITDRKQAEAKIQYRLALEQLIATISTQFINLESEELDRGIQIALQQIGEFAGVDRCYVCEIDDRQQVIRNLYEWCTPGVKSHRVTGKECPLNKYAWFVGQIQRFEVINVPRIADLPPEAAVEKECFEFQSVRSMLNVPMLARGQLLGFMGFDAVRSEKQWQEDDIGLLRIVGETFAHTLERQRTELQLRDSEERFRQLAENIESVFWMTDPAKQETIYVSPAYERIWGSPCQEVYTDPLSFVAAIHDDDRDRIITAIPQQSLGEYDKEYRITRPDGEIRWIRDRAFPIRDDAGKVYRIAGVAEDISDRKRSEEALRAIAEGTATQFGSEFFRSLVRHLAEVLQVRYAFVTQCLDPEKTRVRTLAFWQGQDFGDNFEYDLVNTPCDRVINGQVCLYPRGIQALFPQDRDLVDLGAESYSAIPLNDSAGNILGHLAVIDVKPMIDTRTPELIVRIFAARAGAELERLQAEEALKTSKERLQLAIEGSALGLWDWQIPTGETYFSPQWKTMLGYQEADIANTYTTWINLIHPEDLARVLEVLNAHIEGRIPVYQAEFRMATQQGEWKWIFARAQVFEWDEEGYPLRMTGTHKDISDRKAIERMKDEFISVISHELRTPMTSVRGALGLLATGKLGALTDQGQHMLEIAINNTDRLSRLINDILDLQRIESGQFHLKYRHCNACKLCKQALDMMQDLASQQGISFSFACDATSEIWVDPDYFVQILSNLLSNAIKFSAPETIVSVEATESENYLRFCVRDRGRGIPPEHHDSIFERFHQVDASDSRQKGGTGLGLAICRSLVQLHNGKIWVESTVGEGSSFYFTVPISDRLSANGER
jgi:PAS domain S-box-containing protein